MLRTLIARVLIVAAIAGPSGNAAADSRGAHPLSASGEKTIAPFDPTQSAGLFVGVRQFPYDKTLADVRYAVDDAIDLASLFALDERVHLVDPSRVILALSGEPQKAESKRNLERLVAAGARVRSAGGPDILNALDEQARAAGSNGLLILAFATHGFSRDGTQYLLTATSILHHSQETISESEIRDIASQSDATRSLILLDACRERLIDDRRSGGPDPQSAAPVLRAMDGVHGQVVLSAAAAGQYAYDDEERHNGVFTAAVIDGLRCQASAGEDGVVTVDSLSSFVEKRVLTWIRKNRNSHATRATQVSSEGSAKTMPLAECRRDATTAGKAAATVTTPQSVPPQVTARRGQDHLMATKSSGNPPASKSSGRNVRIVDESGQPVPELIVAARDLENALSLTAQLKTSNSPPDDRLQGLIMAFTSLQVSIMREGHLVDAFTLQTSGVGFTQDASARQARERLATTLAQRLAQEHP